MSLCSTSWASVAFTPLRDNTENRISVPLQAGDGSDAFKRFCTHYIQASAVPTLKRLGIEDEIVSAGALPNRLDMWCPWGRTGESPPFDAKGR